MDTRTHYPQKPCSRCGVARRRPKQRYCRTCHSITSRESEVRQRKELRALREEVALLREQLRVLEERASDVF